MAALKQAAIASVLERNVCTVDSSSSSQQGGSNYTSMEHTTACSSSTDIERQCYFYQKYYIGHTVFYFCHGFIYDSLSMQPSYSYYKDYMQPEASRNLNLPS